LTQKNRASSVSEEQVLDIERLKQRLDMLDSRLDSIDSMVTAIAERVVEQPITLNLTCPRCSRKIEVAVIGNVKPVR